MSVTYLDYVWHEILMSQNNTFCTDTTHTVRDAVAKATGPTTQWKKIRTRKQKAKKKKSMAY